MKAWFFLRLSELDCLKNLAWFRLSFRKSFPCQFFFPSSLGIWDLGFFSLKVFIWKVPECFQSVGFGRFLEGSRVPVFGKSWMRHSGSQSSEGLRLPEVLKGEGSVDSSGRL